jgi:hypothetical protein
MNSKLAQFRERVYGTTTRPAEKIKLRDWVSTIVSLVALTLSGVTAYWNLLRQVDDVGVLIRTAHGIAPHPAGHLWMPNATAYEYVLINAGNRTVIVTDNVLWISHPPKHKVTTDEPCGERDANSRFVATDFKALVLKEKDVTLTSSSLISKPKDESSFLKVD